MSNFWSGLVFIIALAVCMVFVAFIALFMMEPIDDAHP